MRAPHLRTLLDAGSLHFRPGAREAGQIDYVVGWGCKPTAEPARAYARAHGLPYVGLEDGFLRSVGLGVDGAPALSMVVDDVGMYYDAGRPSQLERILNGDAPEMDSLDDAALLARAQAAIDAIVAGGLSKYNGSSTTFQPAASDRRCVLVVDQTDGDQSLRLGQAPTAGVRAVLEAAIAEHPNAEILLKTHPDVLTGKRRSSAGAPDLPSGVVLVTGNINPITLLKRVDHVYVGTSQLGFEALMVGKPVTCFGAPFYAGWGLTDDRVSTPRRIRTRTLPQVFAAAYLQYCRYVDPQTGARGEIEDVIGHLVRQRKMFERNVGNYYCFGFSRWKHDFVRDYLRGPDNEVRFVRNLRQVRRAKVTQGDTLLVWGQKDSDALRSLAHARGARVLRMEDGFLRSVQLGSDLTTPASLVLDGGGIYYDPRTPSDLEAILQGTTFEHDELQRAAMLRAAILRTRVSKYAYGGHRRIAAQAPPDAQVVLVPGQVQDDASIRLGCRDIRENLALLQAVRAARPEAYVVFKPHPDVLSGNRRAGATLEDYQAHCDELVTDVHIADCLDAATEVHTLTSLVGFEALLRGLPVVTYGQPFYSGWGLTEDRHPLTRRTRRLSIDALVAGTLMRYPRYVHPETAEFVEAEAIVAYLAGSGSAGAGRAPLAVRQLRRLLRAIAGVANVR